MSVGSAVGYPRISKDPAVCGGRACVAGTRVRVMDIVSMHASGLNPIQIVSELPSLHGVADVYAALLYYEDHREEIEAELADHQAAIERAERKRQEQRHT